MSLNFMGANTSKLTDFVGSTVTVPAVDAMWLERAAKHLDRLTKPPGSLGRLEEIAGRLVAIYETEHPVCSKKAIFTLAADHGVVAEGVSAYPKVVTQQMVLNFLSGGAAISVLARHYGIEVIVVDIGVDGEFGELTALVKKKIARGTKNMAREAAMTETEVTQAMRVGLDLAKDAQEHGVTLIGTGEMGIGNTTAASAITAVLTGRPAGDVTGRGTGVDDAGFRCKVRAIEQALSVNSPDPHEPMEVLRKVGGLEIAGLTGLILGAASRRIPVVLDGFISTAAAAVAFVIEPNVRDFMFAGHLSSEPGHSALLGFMDLNPLLNLDMRLGEGTGAAIAMSIIEASAKVLNEMATFESAGISESQA
jgi:nicotinate-nucleotide--dimethylbenzimidazole phosphoribosyltransferase